MNILLSMSPPRLQVCYIYKLKHCSLPVKGINVYRGKEKGPKLYTCWKYFLIKLEHFEIRVDLYAVVRNNGESLYFYYCRNVGVGTIDPSLILSKY